MYGEITEPIYHYVVDLFPRVIILWSTCHRKFFFIFFLLLKLPITSLQMEKSNLAKNIEAFRQLVSDY